MTATAQQLAAGRAAHEDRQRETAHRCANRGARLWRACAERERLKRKGRARTALIDADRGAQEAGT